MTALPIGLLLFLGCAPKLTEENAAELTAKAVCSKEQECRPGRYAEYDNRSDCIDDFQDGYQRLIDGLGFFGVELDEDEAGSCLRDLKRASCEEYENGSFSNDCDSLFGF